MNIHDITKILKTELPFLKKKEGTGSLQMFCQIYSFLLYTRGTRICMCRASLQMIHNSPYSMWLYDAYILSYTMYCDL